MTRTLLLISLLAMTACGGGSPAPGSGGAPGTSKLTIAVIPKGTTHVFWKAVESGARAGGEAAGVEVLWKGPLQENDRAQQIAVVQQFLADGVDGLALAPLDHAALRKLRRLVQVEILRQQTVRAHLF